MCYQRRHHISVSNTVNIEEPEPIIKTLLISIFLDL